MRCRGLLAVILLAVAGAAVCAPAAPAGVRAEHAWIRWLPANLPAAGYVVLVNDGDGDATLTGARSADYGMVMLHQSRLDESDSRMEPVASLTVPAHGSVALSPGGYHLMLMHPTRALKPGDTVAITLEFAGGGTLQVDFSVLPANAPGPPEG